MVNPLFDKINMKGAMFFGELGKLGKKFEKRVSKSGRRFQL